MFFVCLVLAMLVVANQEIPAGRKGTKFIKEFVMLSLWGASALYMCCVFFSGAIIVGMDWLLGKCGLAFLEDRKDCMISLSQTNVYALAMYAFITSCAAKMPDIWKAHHIHETVGMDMMGFGGLVILFRLLASGKNQQVPRA